MTAPIVDSLAFLGPSLYGGGQGLDDVMALMVQVGIDVTVVVPSKPPGYHLGPANELVAGAQAQSSGAVLGLARLDPHQEDAVEGLRRALDALGLRGLFLHPQEELFRINAEKVLPLIDVCAARSRPVVVAAGYPWLSEPLQVADLARRFPEVSFVMTNGGQFNISGLGQADAEMALARCSNLSLQTTGVYRQDFIERICSRLGADRVMFAGGSPGFEPGYEVLRARLANLDPTAREMLLGGTAAGVFRIVR